MKCVANILPIFDVLLAFIAGDQFLGRIPWLQLVGRKASLADAFGEELATRILRRGHSDQQKPGAVDLAKKGDLLRSLE